MSSVKLLNVFTLSTLVILLLSFAPSQTLAVSIQSNHLARQLPNHHGITKKKRDKTRCKPRSSSSAPEPTSTPNSGDPPKSEPSPSTAEPPKNAEIAAPNNTTTGPGKFALAWALWDDKRISFFIGPRTRIVHFWDSQKFPALDGINIPFSIMLHDLRPETIANFLERAKPGYATYAYGPNEVNHQGEANASVEEVVDVWRLHINTLADQGYTLGSPSTTSSDDGIVWMGKFKDQCPDCKFDLVAIHWYGVEFEDFKSYVNKWAGFGKPLSITEFGCWNFNGPDQPDENHTLDFADKAINFLENNPSVRFYAPFGALDALPNGCPDSNRLLAPDGPTRLGWKYINGY